MVVQDRGCLGAHQRLRAAQPHPVKGCGRCRTNLTRRPPRQRTLRQTPRGETRSHDLAAMSTVDSAVRYSAAVPRPRTLPQPSGRPQPDMAAAPDRTGGWVALPAGGRPCLPHFLEVAVTCGSSGLEHRVRPRTARVATSTVAAARATTCPRWHLASGCRPGRGLGGRPQARAWPRLSDTVRPDRTPPVRTGLFRKQRTVNPLIRSGSLQLPLRFLKAGPAGGRQNHLAMQCPIA
jgi:hypothetical protein